MPPLRLMVYDRTCTGAPLRPGLSHTWFAGARLYGALRRLDAWRGVTSWAEALDWLGSLDTTAIAEVQYWGHGKWGRVLIDKERLDARALEPDHRLYPRLERLRERFSPGGLWWFRTCQTFATVDGHAFARAWSRFFGCRVAGHTFDIGAIQSGLHSLGPDDEPAWPEHEGVVTARGHRPSRAKRSALWRPNTITCLHGAVPPNF